MLKRVFGKKPPTASPPVSRPGDGMERVFSSALFEGERGAFLRAAGYGPDDPGNIVNLYPAPWEQLTEEFTQLQEVVARMNRECPAPVGPYHFLPPRLWETCFGPFLLQKLDLSPYRPWNTTFLPLTKPGSQMLGLPLCPEVRANEVSDDLNRLMAEIVNIYSGSADGPSTALNMLFGAVRQNHPALFPPEQRDFSPRVATARANVRTLAINQAELHVTVIARCHQTFLAQPELQLIS